MILSLKDIDYCKQIMSRCGPTYYWATKLFPKDLRQATYVLYAFFRVPDDIVDLKTQQTHLKLKRWIKDWQNLYKNPTNSNLQKAHPVLRSAYYIHQKYKIPFHYSDSFLKSMLQDLTKKTYQTYQELQDYMYGSAAVVGIMMTYLIIPNPDQVVLSHAEDLGYAMQLTNFLRDIAEDINDLNRIYMPQSELAEYKIKPSDIRNHQYPTQWPNFMQNQIQKCNQLYRSGHRGFQYLPRRAAWCIKLASEMYQEYLIKIQKSDYKVFHSDYTLKTNQKIFIFLKQLINFSKYAK